MQGDLVVYGADDLEGRALMVVSALHHCGQWLAGRGVRVRFVATAAFGIQFAVEALRGSTGLDTVMSPVTPHAAPDAVFDGAGLYVGVVMKRPGVLGAELARKRGVATLVAVQFPTDEQLTSDHLANLAAAHDPRELARRIRQEVMNLERAQGGAHV